MRIAVLALQGAFIEHERMLQQLGAECFEVRQLSDWNQPKDGLVIPGGESTTMLKLLHDLELLQPIREAIAGGLPVFGTCAGLIQLAKEVDGEEWPRLTTAISWRQDRATSSSRLSIPSWTAICTYTNTSSR